MLTVAGDEAYLSLLHRLKRLEKQLARDTEVMDACRFAWHILERKETLKVDLKWNLPLRSDKQKLDFARDVAALANTRAPEEGENGYLILGCEDPKQKQDSPDVKPRHELKYDPAQIRAFGRQLQQIVGHRCHPCPTVIYNEVQSGEKLYGLITVKPPSWVVQVDVGQSADRKHEVWIRRSPQDPYKDEASPEERRSLLLDFIRSKQLPPAEILQQSTGEIIGLGVVEYLSSLLADEQLDVRTTAIRVFREVGFPPPLRKALVVQLLVGMLLDDELGVVSETLRTLSHLGDARVSWIILDYLQDRENYELQFEAVRTVEAVGDGSAIPRLRDWQRISDRYTELERAELKSAIDEAIADIERREEDKRRRREEEEQRQRERKSEQSGMDG